MRAQCLASWFSCQEISWIFNSSCQYLGNYSWQGSRDFASFFKIVERNPKKFWDFWARKPRLSKILAREPRKACMKKNNFWRKIICSYFQQKKNRNFGKKISAGLSKLHSTCPDERFEDFLEKITFLFISFGLYLQKGSNFWPKFSASSLKMQSGCPGEHLDKKQHFLKKIYVIPDRFWTSSQFFLRTLAKMFEDVCPNCSILVQGKSLSKILCFWKSNSFIHFRNFRKKIGTFGKKITTGSSKLHTRCRGERFERKFFCWKD